MIGKTDFINMTSSSGRSRTIRIKNMIETINNRLKRVSSRKLAQKLDISRTSVRRVLGNDLELRSYKQTIVPQMTNTEKSKRKKKFANWVRTNFKKEDTLKILFSDEKMFDIDGVYNVQNDCMLTVAKLMRKAGENKNENFLKNLWYGSGSVQKGLHHWLFWTKERQIHQGSLTSCYQVWKQGF